MQASRMSSLDWIETPEGLTGLAATLARCTQVAVDTESNSLHAYRERTCLVQFSIPQADALVDTLALKDIAPLAGIFSDPKIEKVFHAVEYDLICLRRDFDICIRNIFDTMQAARILGYEKVGLDAMLAGILGIQLDKKYQKADWGRRPLPQEMLDYARQDTHHLLELRRRLGIELQKRDRWDLAREEFIRLSEGNGNTKTIQPAWQRVRGAQKLDQRQLAVLQELCNWREEAAREMDRPVFKVMDDNRLAAIAVTNPETYNDLVNCGLTARQVNAFGRQLLQAAARGRRKPPVTRPRSTRPSQVLLDRLNRLTEWRKQVGEKVKVDSDIILPKQWLLQVAQQNPRNRDELAALMPNAPWRLFNFGDQILDVLANRSRTKE
jgi:ribonuclease D